MNAKQVTPPGPEKILSTEEELALAREYYTSRTPVLELARKYGYKTRKSVYQVLARISKEEADAKESPAPPQRDAGQEPQAAPTSVNTEVTL